MTHRGVIWVAAAIIALLVVGLVLAGCASKPAAQAPESRLSAPAGAPSTAPTAAVYTCPMHPEVVSDEPGKCPECGMNLVLKKP